MDREIAASIHDFYASAGTALDHLAALIATRLGLPPSKDSLNRLVGKVKSTEPIGEGIMKSLINGGSLVPKSTSWKTVGTLAEIGTVRKRLVHNAPYGSFKLERWGTTDIAVKVGAIEIRKYKRCFVFEGTELEAMDMIRAHYLFLMALFEEAATASGYSLEIRSFSEKDILSMNVSGGRPTRTDQR